MAAGPDRIVRCLLDGGAARVVAVVATGVSREAARRHGAVAGAAVALARGAIAGLLMATLTKDDERVTVQILGNGPLGGVTADARSSGRVRVYLRNPGAPAGGGPGGTILANAIGRRGIVSVVRDIGLGELFTGQTELVTGEIDEDVEHYLRDSEQIASALGCDAALTDRLDVAAAGGVLVQTLPGSAAGGTIREVQHRMRSGVLHEVLAGGGAAADDPAELARAVLGPAGDSLAVLDARPVAFHCACTRDRVGDMLHLLGPAELASMIREQGRADIACNFCGESYGFAGSELEEIRRALAGQSRGQA